MIDAVVALPFTILASYIKLAKQHRHNPWWCVVAQAIRRLKGVVDVKVTRTYTIIWFASGKVIRYRTPAALAEALTYWDRTKEWRLLPGTYTLEVPLPSQTRKRQKLYAKWARQRRANGILYVYGPRGPRKRPINARHFLGCFDRNKAA